MDVEVTGIAGNGAGWWSAWQFDNAVLYFGSYIESKLMETDEHTHKPMHTLEDLLADKQEGTYEGDVAVKRLISLFGVEWR